MSLLQALSVSASGMSAQSVRAQIITENLANSETTRTPEGGPYRRKDIVFESEPQGSPFSAVFQAQLAPGAIGVAAGEVREDDRDPVLRYQPGHPHADARGYVGYPHISPAEEMVDLMGAARGFQANVAAFSAARDMVHKSIDLMR